MCVRESLRHGEANADYLQREDRMLVSLGKASVALSTKLKCERTGVTPVPMRSIHVLCKELGDQA